MHDYTFQFPFKAVCWSLYCNYCSYWMPVFQFLWVQTSKDPLLHLPHFWRSAPDNQNQLQWIHKATPVNQGIGGLGDLGSPTLAMRSHFSEIVLGKPFWDAAFSIFSLWGIVRLPFSMPVSVCCVLSPKEFLNLLGHLVKWSGWQCHGNCIW